MNDEGEKKYIRFGLPAVRGVGEEAAALIVAARRQGGRFSDLQDFCNRVDLNKVSKKAIESLIKAGAMDDLHPEGNRAALMAALDGCIASGKRARADAKSGQRDMFAAMLDKQAQEMEPPGEDEIEIDRDFIVRWGRLAGLRIGDEGDGGTR